MKLENTMEERETFLFSHRFYTHFVYFDSNPPFFFFLLHIPQF